MNVLIMLLVSLVFSVGLEYIGSERNRPPDPGAELGNRQLSCSKVSSRESEKRRIRRFRRPALRGHECHLSPPIRLSLDPLSPKRCWLALEKGRAFTDSHPNALTFHTLRIHNLSRTCKTINFVIQVFCDFFFLLLLLLLFMLFL
ncbi:hypothetical protein ANANG_G00072200 [Anguilla anguilla]|uniref:Secreted protein n=1 Tax=Anguilla anguilla TaxID=7936 RepID=A0A9D3MQY4_ANGAN|nr:hypothetical protein ANANG_G00072200 [Anguilla anguilla]